MTHLKRWNTLIFCSENSLIKSGINIKVTTPLSVHVLGDFNFRDIVWPDRVNKSGSSLSQLEGQKLVDNMNDQGLEQLVHYLTREGNTLDLIMTFLPAQFVEIHSPDSPQWLWHCFWNIESSYSPIKNLGGRSIVIKRVIMNSWEQNHLNLQRKSTSIVTLMLARFKKLQSDYIFQSELCR